MLDLGKGQGIRAHNVLVKELATCHDPEAGCFGDNFRIASASGSSCHLQRVIGHRVVIPRAQAKAGSPFMGLPLRMNWTRGWSTMGEGSSAWPMQVSVVDAGRNEQCRHLPSIVFGDSDGS
eukprot:1158507-Pelagomonas_calceolata.AAC.4